MFGIWIGGPSIVGVGVGDVFLESMEVLLSISKSSLILSLGSANNRMINSGFLELIINNHLPTIRIPLNEDATAPYPTLAFKDV